MTSEHANIGPELHQLAQTILDILEPLVQAAAASAAVTGDPGKCHQVWCPVCAMAAVAAGEQHPLAAVVAEYGAVLLSLLRNTLDGSDRTVPPPGGASVGDAERESGAPGSYQPIAVTLDE